MLRAWRHVLTAWRQKVKRWRGAMQKLNMPTVHVAGTLCKSYKLSYMCHMNWHNQVSQLVKLWYQWQLKSHQLDSILYHSPKPPHILCLPLIGTYLQRFSFTIAHTEKIMLLILQIVRFRGLTFSARWKKKSVEVRIWRLKTVPSLRELQNLQLP